MENETAVAALPEAATIPGPKTPLWWRMAVALAIVLLTVGAYQLHEKLGARGQAGVGIVCFILIAALFSVNLRQVKLRTLVFGMALQFALAFAIIRIDFVGEFFQAVAGVIKQFLDFATDGARFVFGPLAVPSEFGKIYPANGFIFAFAALPTIIFVSSFFTVLYYYGVLQVIVRLMARGMMYLMGTSGAESLSAAANVFMGQTEAPLIVKPYVLRMTQSELLALMVGGMATISGGLMAVYIQMGANPVAILATSVMAAPCGLYLAKLVLPETEEPETRGSAQTTHEQLHRNAIDAAAGGASDGMFLALNVAAMLIAFLAFLALINSFLESLYYTRFFGVHGNSASVGELLGRFLILGIAFVLVWLPIRALCKLYPPLWERLTACPPLLKWGTLVVSLFLFMVFLEWARRLSVEPWSLKMLFSWLFAPAAFLMGVQPEDIAIVANLLGTKLATNEFVAYVELTGPYRDQLNPRSFALATYALTGFANFASVGIQLGGIGAMAPSRRGDLARLGPRALLVGFLATLINASVAGLLLPD